MQAGERADRLVFGTADYGWPEDGVRQAGAAHQLLRAPFGPVIAGRPRLVTRTHRTHVHEPADARAARGCEQAPRALDVHGFERRGAPLHDDPNQMHHDVGALGQRCDGRRVRQIARRALDGESVERPSPAVPADQHADAMAAMREQCGDVPSHESAGSGDGDQHRGGGGPLSRYW